MCTKLLNEATAAATFTSTAAGSLTDAMVSAVRGSLLMAGLSEHGACTLAIDIDYSNTSPSQDAALYRLAERMPATADWRWVAMRGEAFAVDITDFRTPSQRTEHMREEAVKQQRAQASAGACSSPVRWRVSGIETYDEYEYRFIARMGRIGGNLGSRPLVRGPRLSKCASKLTWVARWGRLWARLAARWPHERCESKKETRQLCSRAPPAQFELWFGQSACHFPTHLRTHGRLRRRACPCRGSYHLATHPRTHARLRRSTCLRR